MRKDEVVVGEEYAWFYGRPNTWPDRRVKVLRQEKQEVGTRWNPRTVTGFVVRTLNRETGEEQGNEYFTEARHFKWTWAEEVERQERKQALAEQRQRDGAEAKDVGKRLVPVLRRALGAEDYRVNVGWSGGVTLNLTNGQADRLRRLLEKAEREEEV